MVRTLFVVLLAVGLVCPLLAQDKPAPTPKTDLVKLEGKILVEKDKAGKEIAKIKTADAELVLLDCDKLKELLKVEKLAEKTFVLEGEKAKDKNGKETGFMIKSFEEKKEAPQEEKK